MIVLGHRCPRCGQGRVTMLAAAGILARLGWRTFECPTCRRRFRSFAAVVEEARADEAAGPDVEL